MGLISIADQQQALTGSLMLWVAPKLASSSGCAFENFLADVNLGKTTQLRVVYVKFSVDYTQNYQ